MKRNRRDYALLSMDAYPLRSSGRARPLTRRSQNWKDLPHPKVGSLSILITMLAGVAAWGPAPNFIAFPTLGLAKRDLEKNNVRVIFRKLPSETSPASNLMVNILGSFAEFERELIMEIGRASC